MSIMKVFSVWDASAGAYLPPFTFPSSGLAVRAFSDTVSSSDNSMFSKHPDDFVLFEIGSYDDSTGRFTSLDQPNKLCVAREFLPRDKVNLLAAEASNA